MFTLNQKITENSTERPTFRTVREAIATSGRLGSKGPKKNRQGPDSNRRSLGNQLIEFAQFETDALTTRPPCQVVGLFSSCKNK